MWLLRIRFRRTSAHRLITISILLESSQHFGISEQNVIISLQMF